MSSEEKACLECLALRACLECLALRSLSRSLFCLALRSLSGMPRVPCSPLSRSLALARSRSGARARAPPVIGGEDIYSALLEREPERLSIRSIANWRETL